MNKITTNVQFLESNDVLDSEPLSTLTDYETMQYLDEDDKVLVKFELK